jgi:hypothetical protein
VADARAEAAWGGWTWTPTPADLQRYVGAFRSERLGVVDVVATDAGLQARLGAMVLALEPASAGVFGASESRLEAPLEFRYADDAASLQWKGDTFARVVAPAARD